MLEIYDKQRKKVAILQNATNIVEEESLNSINTLSFSLPCNDSKNIYCQPFNYVKSPKSQLYRIMPSELARDEAGNITYQCEHVIATLIDNVLFGYHVVGNMGYGTKQVIDYILSKQIDKNWVLGRCAFDRQFEYGWEQENLLSALWSVPKPFTEKYIFRFDTNVYPWVLHLDLLDTNVSPQLYIRNNKNMLSISKQSDPKNICTRLYPLGYGEGVNQLGIKDVNGGLPYIQSPNSVVAKYGIVERVWIDRRYEDANSLKAAAQKMLQELQEPYVQYTVGFQQVGEDTFSKAEIGKICRVIDTQLGIDFKTIVTGVTTNYSDIDTSTLQIANKAQDIADTVADIADRQRIEMAYSQGATQIYEKTVVDNASPQEGCIMNFMIPEGMRIVNKVIAKIKIGSFRAYSKATSTTDNTVYTSSSGGGTVTSTGAGGGTVTSTGGGGGTVTSTSSNGEYDDTCGADDWTSGHDGHNHGVDDGVELCVWGGSTSVEGVNGSVMLVNSWPKKVTFRQSGNHTHEFKIPDHTHDVYIDDHTHDISLDDHTHDISLDDHEHDVTIPGHDHEIAPTIAYFGNPKQFMLYLNDSYKGAIFSTDYSLDITKFLLDMDDKIPRNTWIELKIVPDDLAHVQIDLHVQGFVQSRGDNTV